MLSSVHGHGLQNLIQAYWNMALVSEVRKTLGLIHNLLPKNKYSFSTSDHELEHKIM